MEHTFEEDIVIDENKVVQMGVLELAASDIKNRSYVDGKGKKKKGLSTLVKVSNVTSGRDKEFCVGKGSIVDLDEYGHWTVVRIEEERNKHHGFIEFKKE